MISEINAFILLNLFSLVPGLRVPIASPKATLPILCSVAKFKNYVLSTGYSLSVSNPSYVQTLTQGFLSVTSFSFIRRGLVTYINLQNKLQNALVGNYVWPNELSTFERVNGEKGLIIPDGFLLPGQDDGALYYICNPESATSQPVRITHSRPGWFYHRAVYVRLPCQGKVVEGLLTARARKTLFGKGSGELVWITLPADDEQVSNNAVGSIAWPEVVLAEGPDVMFEVVDLDPSDDAVEVVAAHFFGHKLSVNSLRSMPDFPFVMLSDSFELDVDGKPYGLCLASLPNMARKGSDDPFSTHGVPIVNGGSAERVNVPNNQIGEDNSKLVAAAVLRREAENSTTKFDRSIGGRRRSDSNKRLLKKTSQDTRTRVRPSDYPQDVDQYVNMLLGVGRTSQLSNYKGGPKQSGRKRVDKTFALQPAASMMDFATAKNTSSPAFTHLLVTTHDCSYDFFATVKMALAALFQLFPRIRSGTSLRREYGKRRDGGALLLYELPQLKSKLYSSDSLMSTSEVSTRSRTRLPALVSSDIVESISKPLPQFATASNEFREQIISTSTGTVPDTHFAPPSPSLNFGNPGLDGQVENILSLTNNDPIAEPSILSTEVKVESSTNHRNNLARWPCSTLCSGFKVKGWGGLFAPGAPGFPYIFNFPNQKESMPLILLAGDCTGSAYIFTPRIDRPSHLDSLYEMAFEVECGATVGSAASAPATDGSNAVDLFIPSYELNQVHVLRLAMADDTS